MGTKQLLQKFETIRARTESICAPLKLEDHIPQACSFVSPAKWHLAHVSWFFEEMILNTNKASYKAFDPDFSIHFNSYYESLGQRVKRAERGLMTRPTLSAVMDYRRHVNREMLDFLSTTQTSEITDLVELGLQHEQQHQELLLTDIKYLFAQNPTGTLYKKDAALVETINKESGWLEMPSNKYQIGHPSDDFCFDNELGRHDVYLGQYSISKALVTNTEFLSFIEDGGYQNFNFWLDEAWHWNKIHGLEKPMYWKKEKNQWWQFTLGAWRKLQPDHICSHINFYEASAYAEWKGLRLPTEFEWEAASDQLNWGDRWEWTNSAYLAYPNFKKANGTLGEYNGKFMINQMVLRGGSVATSPGHSRKTYRNFFHPSLAWQFNGIRLARS